MKAELLGHRVKTVLGYIFLSRMIIIASFPTRYESLGLCVVLFVEFCTQNMCFNFFYLFH